MRGGCHGGGSCLGGRGRRCLGSTSSDSEVSDSPTELRQRTRKQNAWSLRNPPKRLEFTWCIRLRPATRAWGCKAANPNPNPNPNLGRTFLPLT